MNAKLIKMPERLHLKIELTDYRFSKADQTLTINYLKDGKDEELKLSGKDLLSSLDRCFIIDSFKDDRVTFSCRYDYFDVEAVNGHGQKTYQYEVSLQDFMEEVFSEENANKLILRAEQDTTTKRVASAIASTVQKTIMNIKS